VKVIKIFLVLVLFVIHCCTIHAKGLSVWPSRYNWYEVKPGLRLKCPVAISIRNDSNVLRSYVLRAVLPSELNLDPGEDFVELPSVNWISFEPKIVAINPREYREVDIFIEVPPKRRYLNKKWEFYVEVREYATGLEVFVLVAQVRFRVITSTRLR